MDEAQEFLKQCVEQAVETLERDRENEENVLHFWDYNVIVETIGQAIRQSTYSAAGGSQVDMQKYVQILQESGIMNEDRGNFDQEQIEAIAQASLPSYIFAIYICKGRFPEGEEAIQRDLKLWNEYQSIVDKFSKFGYHRGR